MEELRSFLNSWLIPNDTRIPTETLPELAAKPSVWQGSFARLPAPASRTEVGELMRLRDDLRADVEERGSERLDSWLQRHPQTVRIENERLVYRGAPGTIPELLRLSAQLVAEGRWRRLRTCPDCRWVFYDQSRNNSRAWCSMYAGETGRACGSIAKVKRMRARKSTAEQTG